MLLRTLACGLVGSLLTACTLIAAEGDPPAQSRAEFDWSQWQQLPALDDGRIKPLDTLAEEVVTLVTGRAKWTDPESDVTYRAPELLYAWISAPDEWLARPIIRCEYRPLRKLLDTDHTDVPTEGTYVSVRDVLDWEKSQADGTPVFWSTDLKERLTAIDGASRQNRNPDTVGDTSDDRAINGKVAELFRHLQAFLAVREARNILVVPGLDPRVLTRQTNPDESIPAWVSLGAVLRMDDWTHDREPTVSAIMADSREALLEELLSWRAYPVEHLPQLAQAQNVKDNLQVAMRDVRDAFQQTRTAYNSADAAEFSTALTTFSRKLRQLSEAFEGARAQMTPPEPHSVNFGQWDADLWRAYKPLELDADQMSRSAYPAPDATHLEIVYNKYQPFRFAWIFFLVALIVVALSLMVKTQRTVYTLGLLATAGAVVYSTWGFGLRIAIAGRPPVTNMYETVIWVSYVVAFMGLWFCLLPLTWPGLRWSWRLSGVPLRFSHTAAGRVNGVEVDHLRPDEQHNFLAQSHLPIQLALSVPRLAGAAALVWFLTSSNTSFQIIDPYPPLFNKTISLGSLGTWCVGMGSVLLAAWYVPRVVLALVGFVVTALPEGLRESGKLWEQSFARRYFLLGALPVATLGMMLAYFVGVSSPNILNPQIGSIAAVLRDNYWLTIHVLTIVSSYGAGALAWGIGNLAMLYYLFGHYRKEASPALATTSSGASAPIFDLDSHYKSGDTVAARLRKAGAALQPGRIGGTLKAGFKDFGTADDHLAVAQVRPPKEVSTLATYSYKSMQVAVLLLAAGTILGGLWADVSWGRFWDWDPKEVWALISLLVYLVVLHGRFAGWVGTFGTSVGAVLCFNAILMSWYGVNFVLPQIHGWLNGSNQPTEVGLHSYATGAGGLEYVVAAVIANAALVLLALGRYVVETNEVLDRTPAPKPEKQAVAQQV